MNSDGGKFIFHKLPLSLWLSNAFYNQSHTFQRTATKNWLWAQCRLPQILEFSVTGPGSSRPKEICRTGSRTKRNAAAFNAPQPVSPLVPTRFGWPRQTCWCPCLRAEPLLSNTSALPQACPGAGGKLWVYGLYQLKSCSCSLLLLVTRSNFTAWSFQSRVSYHQGVINNSLEGILKCHSSWLNPIVGY